jgi:membrane fusion protein (multidrug efflux system)
MMLHRITLSACALAVSAASVFGAAEFATAHPAPGTIHRWVALPGVLAPFQQVGLQARVAGYVKTVKVDKGDKVAAGDLLATVEVPELEADLLKAKAEMDAAEIDVKRLREARQKSPDLVLPQSVDNAEARFAGAKASVTRGSVLLEFAQIRAPFAGVIASRSVDPGAYVSPGAGPLLRVVDDKKLRCQIPVTELETPLVKTGKPVRVSVDAIPGQTFESIVARVSGSLDQASRTMLVEADLENAQDKLMPGLSVTARIGVERHENAMLIPTAAIVMEKTNAFVFKHAGGKAVKTAVKLGFNDGVNAEVLELKPEDTLLLVGAAVVNDGQAVTLKTPAAK